MLRSSAKIVLVLLAAVTSLAATPLGPELEDPCGDTRTGAAGQAVEHPMPEGTDLRMVDLIDRVDGGLDVVLEVCGERLALATDDTLRVTWFLPAVDGCDQSRASVEVVNELDQTGLTATYVLECFEDADCIPTIPGGSCGATTVTATAAEAAPLVVDGSRVTVMLDLGDLPSELRDTLRPGAVLADLTAVGSTPLGTNAEYGPAADGSHDLAAVSIVDRARGRDHVVGEDLADDEATGSD